MKIFLKFVVKIFKILKKNLIPNILILDIDNYKIFKNILFKLTIFKIKFPYYIFFNKKMYYTDFYEEIKKNEKHLKQVQYEAIRKMTYNRLIIIKDVTLNDLFSLKPEQRNNIVMFLKRDVCYLYYNIKNDISPFKSLLERKPNYENKQYDLINQLKMINGKVFIIYDNVIINKEISNNLKIEKFTKQDNKNLYDEQIKKVKTGFYSQLYYLKFLGNNKIEEEIKNLKINDLYILWDKGSNNVLLFLNNNILFNESEIWKLEKKEEINVEKQLFFLIECKDRYVLFKDKVIIKEYRKNKNVGNNS